MPGVLDLVVKPGTALPYLDGQAPGIYRGDTWTHVLTFTDGEGDPFDIVGDVTAQLRPSRLSGSDADDPLAEVEVTVVDNVVTMSLEPEVTVELPASWVWDIQQVSGGVTTTLLTGKGKTFDDVVRPNV